MQFPRLPAAAAALLLLAAVSCRRAAAPLPAPVLAADSSRVSTVAPGVVLRSWWIAEGPWAIHALDVDRDRCWALAPVDPAPDGPARELLSGMLARELAREPAREPSRARDRARPLAVAGAVNADFFLFAPDGLPTSAHVRDGQVLFGPAERDVIAADSAGRLRVTRLAVDGWLVAGHDSVRLTRWNRPDPSAIALFDGRYGARVDSARLGLALPLHPMPSGTGASGALVAGRVHRMVASAASGPEAGAPTIPPGGALLVAGRRTSDSVRARLAALGAAGDTVRVRVAVTPFHPRHAVGGFGVLLHEGRVPARLDSVGQASFRGRHPRTAVGFDASGRRLLLVAVDGRQPGYSEGMTLRELAALMRQLGATEALNLDGGGSTALVVPDLRSDGGVRIVNRPSDKVERKVANGLAVVRECRR